MRRKNDILWKGMMEEVFDDLLRFLFPEAEQLVDMDRGFDFLDKELAEMYPEPDKLSDTRYVDKLVKVHLLNGSEQWFLVHLEVQGYSDKLFAERMFRYYYRIFDKYQKPVTTLAIFTGPDGKNMPVSYRHNFMGTKLIYKYNTCCITDYADEMLMTSNNPFAMVLLAAKTALLSEKVLEEKLLNQKLLIARLLYKKDIFSRKKIEAVLTFLNNYILFEHEETNRIFEKQLDQITGKTHTMGIIEQVAEMRAEMKASKARTEERETIVKRLLSETELSPEKIASLAGVSIDTVEKIKKSLHSK
ncbi:hypothetical protein Q4E93_14295 [Flavitalea sp. BT771]|uniref:hypothetical protein n=1 Tax=Flavitalea sp. BT771 TaxID=3063329 RepID=UPI0026E32C42|nr:hypothetical protein [Flavitalea sp. BT771]MDO6431771.1 hypothetical protein [Flavitalea sp. BT771]MDV6220679.1 hypothetical protein [Flavitalea sp. BT771]